jgi:hypothetical protein
VVCVVGNIYGNAVCAIRSPSGNVRIVEDCTFGPCRTDINAMARSPRVNTLASLDELTGGRADPERVSGRGGECDQHRHCHYANCNRTSETCG